MYIELAIGKKLYAGAMVFQVLYPSASDTGQFFYFASNRERAP